MTGGAAVDITQATAGQRLRVEVDAGAGRHGVMVRVEIKDGAGAPHILFNGPVGTGDGPVEWVGPEIPAADRGKKIRVRISDPGTGDALDDSITKIR